ncbi:MAG: flavodoxin [Lachnospiraceae bacterium]|nr:flavodoxin [Lachnospiraceae bacterium]
MKRLMILILSLCTAFALAACGAGADEAAPDSQETTGLTQPEGDEGAEEDSQTDALVSDAETSEPAVSDAEESDAPEENGGKVLVAYFSCTGNTEGIAEKIAEALDADTYKIVPEQPYTDNDLNYSDSSSRSTVEQNDDSCRPAISGSVGNMDDYNVVVIGYPIWWGEAPKIIYTFMESYDFSGKTIVPFCTSGSSGVGSSATNLHGSVSDSVNWLDGTRLSSGASGSDIESWLSGLGLE